jgi:hypothetical protein
VTRLADPMPVASVADPAPVGTPVEPVPVSPSDEPVPLSPTIVGPDAVRRGADVNRADLAATQGRELSTDELLDHARLLGRDPTFDGVDDAELEARFVGLTAELNAQTCRWLELLAELVIRGVWADQGARQPSSWLSWRLGIAPSTAREQIRVALRLRELPAVCDRFAAGRLSYSKVRAITRIAVPELQALLLAWADHATGADLERIARGVRTSRVAASQPPEEQARRRGLDVGFADDGDVLITLRCAPEIGLESLQMLDRLVDLADDADGERAAVDDGAGGGVRGVGDPGATGEAARGRVDHVTAHPTGAARRHRRAEALFTALVAAVAGGPPDTSGADRHTLVIHIEEDDLARGDGALAVSVPGRHRTPVMSARVLRRIACEAGIVPVVLGPGRTPLDVGRRQRRVTAAQRRALHARDRSCRFPGCDATRHLHAHHVVHWADGGPTDLDNLVLLCATHHRTVHQAGWRLEHLGRGRFRFVAPSGRALAVVPALPETELDPEAAVLTAPAEGDGDAGLLAPRDRPSNEALDLDLIVSVVEQELRLAAPHLVVAA